MDSMWIKVQNSWNFACLPKSSYNRRSIILYSRIILFVIQNVQYFHRLDLTGFIPVNFFIFWMTCLFWSSTDWPLGPKPRFSWDKGTVNPATLICFPIVLLNELLANLVTDLRLAYSDSIETELLEFTVRGCDSRFEFRKLLPEFRNRHLSLIFWNKISCEKTLFAW